MLETNSRCKVGAKTPSCVQMHLTLTSTSARSLTASTTRQATVISSTTIPRFLRWTEPTPSGPTDSSRGPGRTNERADHSSLGPAPRLRRAASPAHATRLRSHDLD